MLLTIRFFRSKEALLVMYWTAFTFAIWASPIFLNPSLRPYVLLSTLWFPIAGCLSDVFVMRYTIIHYSLWLVWVLVLLYNIILILQQYAMSQSLAITYIEGMTATVAAIGMAGMWTNTFQFGIDQLTDASSSEITSYISWYVWTFYFALAFFPLLQNCSCGEYNTATSYYLIPLLSTLALVTDCLFNKYLIKEPPTQNPFKLIYQVLKYAAKNKYPRMRSAFTYWEDKPYSRIDLGKAKYGGPFTTEQVEDVKTFFRFVVVIIVSALYFGIGYVLYSSFRDFEGFFTKEYMKSCDKDFDTRYLFHCFQLSTVQYSAPIIMVFLIPVYEFFLYPLLHRWHCIAKVRIKYKMIIGTLLLLVYEVGALVFEITAVSMSNQLQNATCFLYDDQIKDTQIDYKWLILIQPILGIALYILLSSYLELLCAQSPYSMKGFLIGMFYGVGIIVIPMTTGLMQFLQPLIKSSGRKCLMWVYVAVLISTALLMCIHFISLKCYKMRKRDETLRNDHMFAVDYFNKYLPPKPLTVK